MTPAHLEPPLVLIHVDGGIAEEWYTVEGTGLPAVHILDFDRGDEPESETADFVAHARGILDLFKARGVDTSDLDADLDDLDCWLWSNGFAMSRDENDNDVLAGYMDGGSEQEAECRTLRKDAHCPIHP